MCAWPNSMNKINYDMLVLNSIEFIYFKQKKNRIDLTIKQNKTKQKRNFAVMQ